MNARLASIPLALLALSGCATHRSVEPVGRLDSKTVCIVDNPKAALPIRTILERVLVSKGYEVKLLAAGSSPQACPVTALYDGSWVNRGSFHLELSDTIIYKDGKQVGRATYKVDRDASLLSQMANGDTKIEGMAEQLFPGKAGQ